VYVGTVDAGAAVAVVADAGSSTTAAHMAKIE